MLLQSAKMKLLENILRKITNSDFVRYKTDSATREEWKKIPYERGILLTLTLTDKCTLRCEHCFEEAGPENNRFLDANRLDELAEEAMKVFKKYKRRELRVTGGDPFLHPNIYQIIESFSKRREGLEYTCLDVETNGWWATDEKTTRKTISKLKEAGATLLSMTYDYFHCKQNKFDIYEHFHRIEKSAKEEGLELRNILTGILFTEDEEIKKELEKHKEYCSACWGLPNVSPIGRGRSLPEKYWGEHITCTARGCRLNPPTLARVRGKWEQTDEITIGPNGNVYLCNSGKEFEHATLSVGNIYETGLSEILENQNNMIVDLIREEGLRGLSKRAGLSLGKHWKMYDKFSPCGLCHEMLREYGEKIIGA